MCCACFAKLIPLFQYIFMASWGSPLWHSDESYELNSPIILHNNLASFSYGPERQPRSNYVKLGHMVLTSFFWKKRRPEAWVYMNLWAISFFEGIGRMVIRTLAGGRVRVFVNHVTACSKIESTQWQVDKLTCSTKGLLNGLWTKCQ